MNSKQKLILRKLVEINGRRYSELFSFFSYEDKFPYHLKYLLTKGLIKKRDNKYYLTKEGMKVTTHFDTRTLEDINPPSILLLFVCKFKDKYLILEHFEKDQNQNRRIFTLPSGRPLRGLSLQESCLRTFKRKFGIEAKFSYRATFHLIHNTTDGDLLFDDVWLVFNTTLDEAGFRNQKKGYWLTREEIQEFPNTFIPIQKFIIEDAKGHFLEDSIVLNYGIEESDL